jgi:hypothetical protein
VAAGVTGVLVLAAFVAVLVAVLYPEAVNVLLGVPVAVLVGAGLAVRVRVAVLEGRTRRVPVCVTVSEGLAVLITLGSEFSGVEVQISGKDLGGIVFVGRTNVATGVAGGKGLINVWGLMKILMNMVPRARPPSITIEAIMSQNDSLIAFHPSVATYIAGFAGFKPESIQRELTGINHQTTRVYTVRYHS